LTISLYKIKKLKEEAWTLGVQSPFDDVDICREALSRTDNDIKRALMIILKANIRSLENGAKILRDKISKDEEKNYKQRVRDDNRRKRENKKKRTEFSDGDAVGFTNNGKRYLGFIIKRNPKRAKVYVLVGKITGTWTCHYNTLSPVTKEEKILLTLEKLKGNR
jgi:hypothetical protein